MVIGLRNQGIRKIILPAVNAEEASVVDDVEIFAVKHLSEIVDYFLGNDSISPYINPVDVLVDDKVYTEDFSDVAGQDTVKEPFS